MLQFRQGDVLLISVNEIPKSAVATQNKVVAIGESTHHHVVTDDVEVMDDNGNLYLAVAKSGRLEHLTIGTQQKAEHNPIVLDKGKYQVVLQREYDPYEDLIRQVLD